MPTDTSTAYQTGRLSRLRFTPLRDLLRGRLSGRLNVRGLVAAAALPAPIADVILRVVKKTCLWRLEKVDVAHELIAHFTDGLASGESADVLVRDFGDERAAAKLIRRAKRRNRPLAWKALRFATGAVLVFAGLVGFQFARFMVRKATVSVDYVAVLNMPVDRVPPENRAWPLYREALLALDLRNDPTWNRKLGKEDEEYGYSLSLQSARPIDPEWPDLVAWLDNHAAQLELVRRAAKMPAMGFRFGDDGDINDPPMNAIESAGARTWSRKADGYLPKSDIERSMINILLPDLNHHREVANLLAADARVAAERKDGRRLVADLLAMRGLASQLRNPILVNQLVSIGIDALLIETMVRAIADTPELFDDAALLQLAGALAGIGGETASTVFDLSGERAFHADILQRAYTDDGHGDGYLTPDGVRSLASITGSLGYEFTGSKPGESTLLLLASTASTTKSRRAVAYELDRLMTIIERRLAQRGWIVEAANPGAPDPIEARFVEIRASNLELLKLYPVLVLMSSFNNLPLNAERALSRRDGIVVGIALERHRRRTGAYPATLDVLVGDLLPRMPSDPITGEPMKYRLIDGKPVIYSVGVDRDDDGGRLPVGKDGEPNEWAAFAWRQPQKPIDGDWILYPQPIIPDEDGEDEAESLTLPTPQATTQAVSGPTN